jgi:hypothetical protein
MAKCFINYSGLSMRQNCPLCNTLSETFYKNEDAYYKCHNCYAVFVDKYNRVDKVLEQKRYELHQNSVEDKDYQKFVSPITSAILRDFKIGDKGLDFGAGTAPVLSKVLQDNNYSIKPYDPYFHNYPELLEQKYDYIGSCEVIEHFYNPYKEFKLLKKLLNPHAKLYCMTEIYSEKIDFASWYYKNDPTHVFFYHSKTFEWIKEKFYFSKIKIENRLITFTN